MMAIRWNGRIFRVKVRRVSHDRAKECFDVIGNNKTIMIESNRPILALKKLDNWHPTYKIISGKFNSPGFDKSLVDALHQGILNYEKANKRS